MILIDEAFEILTYERILSPQKIIQTYNRVLLSPIYQI
jgi:hypothetical protein